jgi:hypothetical protein
MSSTIGTQTCNLALDGIIYGGTNNGYNNGVGAAQYNFAMTNNDAAPFITVDLGFSTSVNSIKVAGRQDVWGASARLDAFEIYVGMSPLWSQNTRCDPTNIPASLLGLNFNTALFPCALTGRYVTIHIPAGTWSSPSWFQDPVFGNNWYNQQDGYLNVNELQVFANNGCPAYVAAGATMVPGSVCVGAGWGATCAYTCNPGWIDVSGTSISHCNGAVWDSPPLVCQPPCADLPAPQYSSSCTQTLYNDNFNVDGSLSALTSLDPVNQVLGIPSTNPPLRECPSRGPQAAFSPAHAKP